MSEEVRKPLASARPHKKWPLSRLVARLALGAIKGAAILLILITIVFRETMPELTPERLAAAQRLWEQQGPRSYDEDLVISGRRPGTVHIEVRDGTVTAMTREGHTPRQRRTWEYWRIESQFDTMAQDLDSAEHPTTGFGAPQGSRAVLRADFDPKYGYPRRYQRIVLGTDLNVEWETTHFRPLP